jgi:hypothetical protein
MPGNVTALQKNIKSLELNSDVSHADPVCNDEN